MQWMKHYANASSSVKLNKLVDKLGLTAYARYWLLMELICEDFDGESITFEVHFRQLSKQLQVRLNSSLTKFMEVLNSVELVGQLHIENQTYVFDAPILLELQSRDFNKARKDRAAAVPKIKIKNKKKIKTKNKNNKTEKPSTSKLC